MKLTKEWLLKTISELEEERDAIPGSVNEDAAMALAAMTLALVSLETDGAAECQHDWSFGGLNKLQSQKQCVKCGRVEMVAPPAPVVPDAIEMDDDFDSAFEHGTAVGWNACRAAMLQGAADNSPAIPDGWVACSERMPEESGRYLCCVEDKDGLEKYQWICTWDGENPSSPLWNHYGDWVTHWMELPEDPQQDVNPIGGSATYDFSTDEVVTNPPPERGYVVTCDGADHFYRNNQEAQKLVMDAINRRSAPVSLVTLECVTEKWVLCSDRLPEPGRWLALFGKKLDEKCDAHVDEGYIGSDGNFYFFDWESGPRIGDCDLRDKAEVTHWMYWDLPEAPGKEPK